MTFLITVTLELDDWNRMIAALGQLRPDEELCRAVEELNRQIQASIQEMETEV